jgi:hypothetical protein
MPEISRFLGIVVAMYFREHSPPHFHIVYNEYRAEIDIKTMAILDGKLPPRVRGLVAEWAEVHREELLKNWDLMQAGKKFSKIQPLV